MRRTKIVCTIGPASRSRERIADLIRAGMNVARLNFSHGTHEDHGKVIDLVREVSAELGTRVAVLQDLQGPKIRIGTLVANPTRLTRGALVTITTDDRQGTAERLTTTYSALPDDVRPGDRILMSDGLVELRVLGVEGRDVRCEVARGGLVGEHSGLNLPGVRVSSPSLTPKDLDDLRFGIERAVDYVAISFVRCADDVLSARRFIRDAGSDIPVIAKLEKPEAIENLEAILDAANGVMVARGDLGVEVSVEQVPILQKRIIALANKRSLPVITATQMLESMVHNASPTRAEASDVANAILDGTDAVMLSEETAIGDYPIEVVETMARIAEEAEAAPDAFRIVQQPTDPSGSFPHVIAEAASMAARHLPAAAIVAITQSGFTPLIVSKYRSPTPIIAVTRSEKVARRLPLLWNVQDQIVVGYTAEIDEVLAAVVDRCRQTGMVVAGDTIVLTASAPVVPLHGVTNMLEVRRL